MRQVVLVVEVRRVEEDAEPWYSRGEGQGVSWL